MLGPVIQKTLKMGVVPACVVLMMKWGPQNITDRPSVSIMLLGGLACGPMTCLFVCGISLTSGQLFNELFPDCTRSCFSEVVSRRRGGDRHYEMTCLFVAVGPNARFIVLPHWDNMS